MAAMDWLVERQDADRADARAPPPAQRSERNAFVLYDLSSSYMEGRCCPLATLGLLARRCEGQAAGQLRADLQPRGPPRRRARARGQRHRPADRSRHVADLRERFGIEQVVFVGDRGMITQAHAQTLKEQGVDFISALKSVQIRSLVNSGDLQLSLFDEVNLAEISSPLFAGERLVVCRNPAVAAERARKRAELLAATEAELEKVKASVHGPRGRLRDAPRRSDRRARRQGLKQVQGRQALHPEDHRRRLRLRAQDRADQHRGRLGRPLRDPHHPPRQTLGAPAAVRAYKQLKMAERAFGTMKDTIEIRPIHHHLETRVRAHVFLCMLAYYVSFELQARLPELLFTDETPLAPTDPVKPATRSASAQAKAGSATTADGYPAHTLPDLLADLATICRNTVRIGTAEHTFTRLTTPTPLQAHALELLDVKLHE